MISDTIEVLTTFMREKNFEPCCQTCGALAQTVGFMPKSARLHLCADCVARARSENEVKAQGREQEGLYDEKSFSI